MNLNKSLLDVARLTATVPEGAAITVGVSGGADSVCLLHSLHCLGRYRMSVAHVNHGLRGCESDAEENSVCNLANKLGLPFLAFRIPHGTFETLKNTTLEEALRTERHRLLKEAADINSSEFVAIGHSADDLAETFLMRILRGTGTKGLCFDFLTPHDSVMHIRPLWKTFRFDIEAYCIKHNLNFVVDSSNNDTCFTRNKIRHMLLPMLESNFNPKARKSIFSAAIAISNLCKQTNAAIPILKPQLSAQPDELNISAILSRPEHERGHLVYQWLEWHLNDRPAKAHIESALSLMMTPGETDTTVRLAQTQQLAKHANALCVVPIDTTVPLTPEEQGIRWLAARSCLQNPQLLVARIDSPIPVEFSGDAFVGTVTDLNGNIKTLDLTIIKRDPSNIRQKQFFLRNRQHADKIAASSVRLKQMLCNDKIPGYLRDYLVVLVDNYGNVYSVASVPRIQKRISLASGITVQWHINTTI